MSRVLTMPSPSRYARQEPHDGYQMALSGYSAVLSFKVFTGENTQSAVGGSRGMAGMRNASAAIYGNDDPAYYPSRLAVIYRSLSYPIFDGIHNGQVRSYPLEKEQINVESIDDAITIEICEAGAARWLSDGTIWVFCCSFLQSLHRRESLHASVNRKQSPQSDYCNSFVPEQLQRRPTSQTNVNASTRNHDPMNIYAITTFVA